MRQSGRARPRRTGPRPDQACPAAGDPGWGPAGIIRL